jgi:hypothetical protein
MPQSQKSLIDQTVYLTFQAAYWTVMVQHPGLTWARLNVGVMTQPTPPRNDPAIPAKPLIPVPVPENPIMTGSNDFSSWDLRMFQMIVRCGAWAVMVTTRGRLKETIFKAHNRCEVPSIWNRLLLDQNSLDSVTLVSLVIECPIICPMRDAYDHHE